MWIGISVAAGVLAVLVIILIASYNSAAKKKLRVENAFSQIKIQYKKRADLVPYLADVVKSYAKYEGTTFKSSAVGDGVPPDSPKVLSETEFHTNRALKDIFLLAQKNPEVKTNANFLQLQNELVNLEKAIAVSRGFYNDAVMMYNRTVKTFPVNIFAKMFGFKAAEFIDQSVESESVIKGAKCPACGAVSNSPLCPHCGTRIPLI